tara:strand:- start:1397 stop:2614 length:1218 start_codon:yes stop_codon:yes gene_type:complete
MPVLPKNQLKLLFESGDLITETTLDDLINATYNPTLIAGAGIFLSEVSTPAGTDITISVTGATSGTVTSVGLSMPSAFTITNSPVTSTGTLTVTGAGTTLQYIDGTGALQTFPAVGGTYTNSNQTLVNFPSDVNPAIPVNSTFTAQTFTEMMNKMLYPTQNPAIQPPTQTLSISPGPQVNQYQEIGASITVTLTGTFNQGTIVPAYSGGPSVRSGVPVTYNFSGPQVSAQTTSSLGPITESTGAYQILIGAQTWTNSITYLAGQMPLNSDGLPYNPPGALPGGTTSTISKTITGVYPVYATTVNINTLTIQSLQSMAAGGYIEVTMVNESVFPPIFAAIDIPQLWSTITGYETFNTQNNTWTPGSLATDWITTTSQRTINSQAVDYVLYTRTGSPGATAQYRFLT